MKFVCRLNCKQAVFILIVNMISSNLTNICIYVVVLHEYIRSTRYISSQKLGTTYEDLPNWI